MAGTSSLGSLGAAFAFAFVFAEPLALAPAGGAIIALLEELPPNPPTRISGDDGAGAAFATAGDELAGFAAPDGGGAEAAPAFAGFARFAGFGLYLPLGSSSSTSVCSSSDSAGGGAAAAAPNRKS